MNIWKNIFKSKAYDVSNVFRASSWKYVSYFYLIRSFDVLVKNVI